jgi:hypothetical protein
MYRLLDDREKAIEGDQWYDWFDNTWKPVLKDMLGTTGTSRPPLRRQMSKAAVSQVLSEDPRELEAQRQIRGLRAQFGRKEKKADGV